MKVRALADLSGTVGDRAAGDEFVTDATTAQSLIDRGLAAKIEDDASAPTKPAKAKE
ncbi:MULTISPECIES: hypothetical protein [Pseudomonas]|uniref:hypothetical protein n=1 Tax=Pseudomonas TaxID=286 RepID=UPI00257E17F8|nr:MULTISPECIES: hypothetical protein [Pseudomonas]